MGIPCLAPAAVRVAGSSDVEEKLWLSGELTGHLRPFKNGWNMSFLVGEALRVSAPGVPAAWKCRLSIPPLHRLLVLPSLSGGMVCTAPPHLLPSCSSGSEIQAAVFWVWGHLFSTTSGPARPREGWKPPSHSGERGSDTRCGSPTGLWVLRCIWKGEVVPRSRCILSGPWARRTGTSERQTAWEGVSAAASPEGYGAATPASAPLHAGAGRALGVEPGM